MQSNKFLKVTNSLLELEKDVVGLKNKELNDREVQIKIEIKELFFKPILVSIDDMDRFEHKERKKRRQVKNTWYEWLINYIPEFIRKSVGSFKDKFISFFRQMHLNQGKKVSKPKT